MVRLHSLRIAVATVGLGLALAACGTAETPTSPTPADTGTTGGSMNMCAPGVPDCNDMGTEDPTGGDERIMSGEVPIVTEFVGPVRVVEQAPGSVAEPFALLLQEAVVEGRMVTVSFSGGEAPCFVVDHVEVDEADDAVRVTVFAGQPDPDADCSQQSTSLQAVSFEIEADLGSRQIHDGSRTATGGDNV